MGTFVKLQVASSLYTVKLTPAQTVQSATTPCGLGTRSSLTPVKVPTVADKISLVQVLAWKTTEVLHTSNVPVLEALANFLPTVSLFGCESSARVNNSKIHSCKH